MVTLQQLREMILEASSDGDIHTRQELIRSAQKKYDMRLYDADQRVTSAIKSLIKKGDLSKLEKGVYQLPSGQDMVEHNMKQNDMPHMDQIM